MFLRNPNDRALLVPVAGFIAVVAVALAYGAEHTVETVSGSASAATIVATAPPADYGAPALRGITATRATTGAIANIVRDPTDLPPPVGNRGPRRVRIDLETIELTGTLADGATYGYWTFNGKVPGPMVRVRVGDIVEVHLKNRGDSTMLHNVDFHAVTGPGGGAKATDAAPGEARGFEFKAVHAGLYVYHCAIPMAAQHISNGMYGMILVEPDGGLPKVDHEFYVMQGEIYTEVAFGGKGMQAPSYEKLVDERPDYYVFNGAVGALTTQQPLKARVGETVRIYFGVGGPNKTSSFHVIGEVFDRVYNLGSLTTAVTNDVQTVSVPPGGATVVDFKVDVPGDYMLVDHALSRVEHGLAGVLRVEGPANVALFRDYDPQRSASSTGH